MPDIEEERYDLPTAETGDEPTEAAARLNLAPDKRIEAYFKANPSVEIKAPRALVGLGYETLQERFREVQDTFAEISRLDFETVSAPESLREDLRSRMATLTDYADNLREAMQEVAEKDKLASQERDQQSLSQAKTKLEAEVSQAPDPDDDGQMAA